MAARAILILLALAAGLLPLPSAMVERYYSNGVYPPLQRAVTGASNLVPFALFDALLVVALGWWLGRLIVDLAAARRRGWARAAAAITLRTLTLAAAVYLAFLAAWGFNYRRVPVPHKVAYDEAAVTADAAQALARRAAAESNALHAAAHAAIAAGPFEPALERAFASVQQSLGARRPARAARVKHTLLNAYFRAAGVDGMTNPFFLETLVVNDLLPVERPFVVAHEWSHLAGYNDEGEANFVGWLTCMAADPAARYSGWLFLYREVAARLDSAARRDVAATLGEGPRADVAAIAERLRRAVKPRVSAAGWRAYDSYLKANRVDAGAQSYAEVVRLILGTRFTGEWVPVRR